MPKGTQYVNHHFDMSCNSGGSSLFPQMRERLEKELTEAAPQAAKVKVMLPVNTTERRYSVWIGETRCLPCSVCVGNFNLLMDSCEANAYKLLRIFKSLNFMGQVKLEDEKGR